MSAKVLSIDEINLDNLDKDLTFSDLKSYDNGGKFVDVFYKGERFMVLTPKMRSPFGFNIDENEGKKKYTLHLSFIGNNNDENSKDSKSVENTYTYKFQKLVEKIDEQFIKEGYEKNWLKKKFNSVETLKQLDLYKTMVIYSKDKNGDVTTKYPPRFKMKLTLQDAGSDTKPKFPTQVLLRDKKSKKNIEVDILDPKKNPDTTRVLVDEAKGSSFRAVVRFGSIWISGPNFGCTPQCTSLEMIPREKSIIDIFAKDPYNEDDSDNSDDEIVNSKSISNKEKKSVSTLIDDSDSENEENEENNDIKEELGKIEITNKIDSDDDDYEKIVEGISNTQISKDDENSSSEDENSSSDDGNDKKPKAKPKAVKKK